MFTNSKLCRQFTHVKHLMCCGGSTTGSCVSWHYVAQTTCRKTAFCQSCQRVSSHQRCWNATTCHHTSNACWARNTGYWWQQWNIVTRCHEWWYGVRQTGLQLHVAACSRLQWHTDILSIGNLHWSANEKILKPQHYYWHINGGLTGNRGLA